MSHHFEYTTDRISGSQSFVDLVFHALLDIGISTTQQDFTPLSQCQNLFPRDISFR